MRKRLLVLLASPIVLLAAAPCLARCLGYEPNRITLTGQIVHKRLPGPPNYRSVAHGDRPESVYFVALDQPVCVSADPTSSRNTRSYAGITEIQLLISPVEGSTAVGKRMRISGTLSSAQSGYHRTPVLLTVKEMNPA